MPSCPSSPPPHDDVSNGPTQAEVSADVATPGPHQSSTHGFMDVIRNALSFPADKKAKAIDDLGDSAFSIEVCFTNVSHGLVNTLAEASTEQRESILQFQEDWDRYRKAYIDLLWSCRVVAGQTRASAEDFAKNFVDFLDDKSISLEDKKEEIKGYRTKLEEDIKGSQDLRQQFVDLQTKIKEFQKKVTDWLKHNKQRKGAGMQSVHTILDALESDMTLIPKKLGMFSKIWDLINADLVKVQKDMATTSKKDSSLKKRLHIEQVYSALSDALYRYETRVHTQPGSADGK